MESANKIYDEYQADRIKWIFDELMITFRLISDIGLARLLVTSPANISNMRYRRIAFGATTIFRVSLVTGWPPLAIKSFLTGKSSERLLKSIDNSRYKQSWLEPSSTAENTAKLFDHVQGLLNQKNDVSLARVLQITPATLSRLKRGLLPLRSSVILRIQECSTMHLYDIMEMLDGTHHDEVATN